MAISPYQLGLCIQMPEQFVHSWEYVSVAQTGRRRGRVLGLEDQPLGVFIDRVFYHELVRIGYPREESAERCRCVNDNVSMQKSHRAFCCRCM